MARGKGEIKGWITRNGVHIPIYDNYTVRGNEEPKAKFKSGKKRIKELGDRLREKKSIGYKDLEEYMNQPGSTLEANYRDWRGGESFYVTNKDDDGDGIKVTAAAAKKYIEKNGDSLNNERNGGEYQHSYSKKSNNAATKGESDASKGKKVEGKGAVKDVEGKKPVTQAEEENRPKNFKEGLKQHEGIQQIAEAQNKKVWNGGASNQELYDAADKFAESKNFNKDKVRDAAFSAFNEKWVATQQEQESSLKPAYEGQQDAYISNAYKEGQRYSISGFNEKKTPIKGTYVNSTKRTGEDTYNMGDWHHFRGDDGTLYTVMDSDIKNGSVSFKPTRENKKSSTISAEDHKQATDYLKGNLKAALPTSVSGLKQAYATATGEEKSAIRAELRKKGYTYVGGKWVKA